jgi:hypothetical protein
MSKFDDEIPIRNVFTVIFHTCLCKNKIVVYLTSLCVNWAFLARVERFKGPRVPKTAQFTHERVEYNVFLFD